MRVDKYLVEFIGSLLFMYVVLSTGHPLAIGIALAIAIYVGAGVSGGMFNPAISVMMTVAGKMSVNDLLPYIVVQVLGGVFAYELYRRLR